MNMLGWVHTLFGVAAILLGAAIYAGRKGTRLHRTLGLSYVVAMLGLNITALMIYRLFCRFGPFHALAIMSLITLLAGWFNVQFKRPKANWLRKHYEHMGWSYIGLLAATAAEIAVRLPFLKGSGLAFALTTFISSFVVIFIGAYLLYRKRDAVLAPFQPSVAKDARPIRQVDAAE